MLVLYHSNNCSCCNFGCTCHHITDIPSKPVAGVSNPNPTNYMFTQALPHPQPIMKDYTILERREVERREEVPYPPISYDPAYPSAPPQGTSWSY